MEPSNWGKGTDHELYQPQDTSAAGQAKYETVAQSS